MNRREFLHQTALLAGAAIAPSALTAEAADPDAHAASVPAFLRAQRRLRRHDPDARRLLARMTLEEKVGQMIQAEAGSLHSPDDVVRYSLGSVLSGGNDDPAAGNGLVAWTDRYDDLQSRALTSRLGIPLLYGVDAVHGHNNVLDATIFPHNIGLGCTRSERLVEEAARITALETRATGIQWTFAPCVAVPRDLRWGRTYEGFGESPALARRLGRAAVRGLQGPELGGATRVLACAKHFVGDGGTTFGTGAAKDPPATGHWPLDRGDTRLGEGLLRHLHMQGYVGALEAGVGTIMPSYSSWNGEKCTGSHHLLVDILKVELGFAGFLISDYNATDELPGDRAAQVARAVVAGTDMLMVPSRYAETHALLLRLVHDGRVSMRRIDGAVLRILRVKLAMRLDRRGPSPLADRALHRSFGAAAHRAAARECVRRSLVLLRNEHRLLPLSKHAERIHVAGRCADDMGNQCGGWTVSWQGKSGNDVVTGGTTILAGIRAAVSPATSVTWSRDGSGAEGATVGIAVIGEPPYAEMFGDRETLALDDEDAAVVERMRSSGMPVVVVLVSGRPLVLGDTLHHCDALVAAWLPGTEGAGVADVLFGDHAPTGRLSHSWPRSSDQLPLDIGDRPYDPLFPYGAGLGY